MWDAINIRGTFLCLYLTSGLIYLRNVYRIVSYASPPKSDINIHEGYFIAFESTAIFLAMAVYSVLHFDRVLPVDPEAYVTPGLCVKDTTDEESGGCHGRYQGCPVCPLSGRSVVPGCGVCEGC